MHWEEKIDNWAKAHMEELVADIGRLTRINSVSVQQPGAQPFGSDCALALDTFLEMAKGYGFATENYNGFGGGAFLGDGEKSIGLWGHLDIVPVGDDGWLWPALGCTRVGDFIIGRGVQDNKGPSTLDLYVLRCLRDLNVPLRSKIAVYVGVSEETGMGDIPEILRHIKPPELSLVTDSTFPLSYGEKGNWRARLLGEAALDQIVSIEGGTVPNVVPDFCHLTLKPTAKAEQALARLPASVTAQKTNEGFRLSAKGLSKHAAAPESGVNAIRVLLEGLLSTGLLEGKEKETIAFLASVTATTDGSALGIACTDDELGPLTCVGSVIRSEGQAIHLALDVRYPRSIDSDTLTARTKEAGAAFGVTPIEIVNNSGYLFDRNSPKLQVLLRVYQEVTGQKGEPYVMGGGTYARKLPNAVAFGPGLPRNIEALGLPKGHGDGHTPNETDYLPNLLVALKIYVLSLIALDELI